MASTSAFVASMRLSRIPRLRHGVRALQRRHVAAVGQQFQHGLDHAQAEAAGILGHGNGQPALRRTSVAAKLDGGTHGRSFLYRTMVAM